MYKPPTERRATRRIRPLGDYSDNDPYPLVALDPGIHARHFLGLLVEGRI